MDPPNCVQNGSKSSDRESSFVERFILSLRTFRCSKHWKLMSENEAKQVSMHGNVITAASASFAEDKVSASESNGCADTDRELS